MISAFTLCQGLTGLYDSMKLLPHSLWYSGKVSRIFLEYLYPAHLKLSQPLPHSKLALLFELFVWNKALSSVPSLRAETKRHP